MQLPHRSSTRLLCSFSHPTSCQLLLLLEFSLFFYSFIYRLFKLLSIKYGTTTDSKLVRTGRLILLSYFVLVLLYLVVLNVKGN